MFDKVSPGRVCQSHTVVGVQNRVRRVAQWDTPRCQNNDVDLGLSAGITDLLLTALSILECAILRVVLWDPLGVVKIGLDDRWYTAVFLDRFLASPMVMPGPSISHLATIRPLNSVPCEHF